MKATRARIRRPRVKLFRGPWTRWSRAAAETQPTELQIWHSAYLARNPAILGPRRFREFRMALQAGEWRIEQVILDDIPRLKLTRLGYLVGPGYYSSPAAVAHALKAAGGPGLAEFEPELPVPGTPIAGTAPTCPCS